MDAKNDTIEKLSKAWTSPASPSTDVGSLVNKFEQFTVSPQENEKGNKLKNFKEV
ncbi:MAG TPA: hypothetical protein PLS50_05285 [Candidatus Dojkabacteria bacterium]|nr:hypothetical protein [Candidatus Dojkabacteria bacterium]